MRIDFPPNEIGYEFLPVMIFQLRQKMFFRALCYKLSSRLSDFRAISI